MLLDTARAPLLAVLTGVAAAVALAVGGCSPRSQEPADGRVTDAATPDQSSVADAAQPPAADSHLPFTVDTPLAPYKEFLDGPRFDLAKGQTALEDAHAEREASIGACMKEAGFDYEPRPYTYNLEADKGARWLFTRAAYLPFPVLHEDRIVVEEWGYGLDPDDYYDLAMVDEDVMVEADRKEQERLAAMSEAERSAYQTALTGSDYQPGDPTPPPESLGGCMGDAYEQTPEEAPGDTDAFFLEFGELAVQVSEVTMQDVAADPRARAASKEWNVCMLDRGVDLDPGEPIADSFYVNESSPALAEIYARNLSLNGEGLGVLEATPEQVEVALADFDCRAETGYIDAIMEVQLDLEQRFLSEHQPELDRMRAAAGGQ
jgi:hypothetical protein